MNICTPHPAVGRFRGRLLVSLLLALLLVPAACADNSANNSASIPDFTLESAVDGSPISNSDFNGQAMVVTFFATWCPPCRQEAPILAALHDKYGGEDFTVLGISVDQGGPRQVRGFMNETGINYPVAMSAPDTPKNFGDVFGVPTSFLVDSQGRIIQRFDGHVDLQVLERELKAILG